VLKSSTLSAEIQHIAAHGDFFARENFKKKFPQAVAMPNVP